MPHQLILNLRLFTCNILRKFVRMASMQSAMNYLRRRFSDTNFNSNLSNGYMVDTQSDEGFERKESTPHSTNSGAMNPGEPACQSSLPKNISK